MTDKVSVVDTIKSEINRLLLGTDETFETVDHKLPLSHLGIDSHGVISIFVSLQCEAGVDISNMGKHTYPKNLAGLIDLAENLVAT